MIKYFKKNPIYCSWILVTSLIMGVLDPIMAFNVTAINAHVFGSVSFENLSTVDGFWLLVMFGPYIVVSLIFVPFIIAFEK